MSKLKAGDRVVLSDKGKKYLQHSYKSPYNSSGKVVSVYTEPELAETEYQIQWDYYVPRIRGSYLELVHKESDNVNSPSHYGQGKIECIDYISDFLTKEEYIGYLRGNVAKYLHRWRYKNGIEDLKKANWYLDRLMWEIEGDKN